MSIRSKTATYDMDRYQGARSATRRVHIAGTTTNPTSAWMEQIARNLTDYEAGFLNGKRFLIIDRDTIFSPRFKSILIGSGVEVLLTAYQAPNMNAYAERFVRSIKSECLDQMIFLGRESLVRAIAEYATHYHDEPSHQGIGNVMISGRRVKARASSKSENALGGYSSTIIDGRRSSIEFSDITPCGWCAST